MPRRATRRTASPSPRTAAAPWVVDPTSGLGLDAQALRARLGAAELEDWTLVSCVWEDGRVVTTATFAPLPGVELRWERRALTEAQVAALPTHLRPDQVIRAAVWVRDEPFEAYMLGDYHEDSCVAPGVFRERLVITSPGDVDGRVRDEQVMGVAYGFYSHEEWAAQVITLLERGEERAPVQMLVDRGALGRPRFS